MPSAAVSALLLLGSLEVAAAAEGWTYTIVAEAPELSGLEFSHVSLRETGEVVYSTLECSPGDCTRTIRTWADGITQTLLEEQMSVGRSAYTVHLSPTGRTTFAGRCNPLDT